MKSDIETVSSQLESIFGVFFKYILRSDQSKIEKGFGRTHYEVLSALLIAEKDNEVISLSEIAKRLLISKAYTTALTDKLFKEGLIERIPDKDDRRVIKIILTKKGRIVLREKTEDNISTYKKRLSNLTEDDLGVLSRSFEDIKKILSKIEVNDFN